VPERAEEHVGQRRVRVGELGDEAEAVVEIECGRNVVAAFVPVIGEVQEGEVGKCDCSEEDGKEGERGKAG